MYTSFDPETAEWRAVDPLYPQLPPGYGDSEQSAEIAALESVSRYLDHLRHGNAAAEVVRLWLEAWELIDKRTDGEGAIDDDDGAVTSALLAARHLESLIFPGL